MTKPIPTSLISKTTIGLPLEAPGTPLELHESVITFEQHRQLMDLKDYRRRSTTQFIVVHCSDTPTYMNVDAATIRGWHVTERGWDDIGYNFVIRRDGTIENGIPVWAVGAGVKGINSRSIHICLAGGRNGGMNPMKTTAAELYNSSQLHALKFLLANLKAHLYPRADIRGHRDCPLAEKGKTCPNFDVKSWLGADAASFWPQWDHYVVTPDAFPGA